MDQPTNFTLIKENTMVQLFIFGPFIFLLIGMVCDWGVDDIK